MRPISIRWDLLVRFTPALGLLTLLIALSCEKLDGALCPGGTVLCGAGYKCVDKAKGEGYECARSSCGDGRTDESNGEQCDNGDNLNGDGCGSTCKLEQCGNKVRDPGEPCDPTAGDEGCNGNCTLGSCGDGKLDSLEACDPGQNDQLPESRACKKDCTGTVLCGNGTLDEGEECDSSVADAGQVNCGPTCLLPACGNGVRDTGEACDDGNREEDYTCSADCSSDNTCGNGLIDNRFGPGDSRNEKCDDGQRTDSKGCKDACKTATGCKNGKNDSWEECDPTAPGTEPGQCDEDCSRPLCGDGILNKPAGELCEPQDEENKAEQEPLDQDGNTAACNSVNAGQAACQSPSCGDSWTNKAAGEQCDNGKQGDTAECNGSNAKASYGSLTVGCRVPECGDGYVNQAAGEECDYGPMPEGRKDWPAPEGNEQPAVGCNGPGAVELACKLQRCGDGYVHDDECGEADALNKETGIGCNGSSAPREVQCKLSACGDGYANRTAGEVCDPGVAVETAACNGPNAGPRACQPPVCGDGYANGAAREDCDPGDPTPGDEFTAEDERDPAWMSCNGISAGVLACSKRSCGDNFKHPHEACDSGHNDTASCNSTTNDRGKPNREEVACTEVKCGDGYVNIPAGETCDPGDKPLTNDKDWEGDKDHPEEFCNGPNAKDLDGKSVACRLMECGDGYKHVSECGEDDAPGCNGVNAPQGLECKTSRCGDEYLNIQAGEQCDRGDADAQDCNGSGASARACQRSVCGDGYTNEAAGEKCDPGGQGADSADCNGNEANAASCKKSVCGDGHANKQSASGTDVRGAPSTEKCDNGEEDTVGCNGSTGPSACQVSTCGDGRVNKAAGEECDPGVKPLTNKDWVGDTGHPETFCNGPDAKDRDGNSVACRLMKCGDGYKHFSECGEDDAPGCNGVNAPQGLDCKASQCGDEYLNLDSGELCDFGEADTPVCNGRNAGLLACQPAVCGDGHPNKEAGEDCDPEDSAGADSAECNGNSAGSASCKTPTCGDGHTNDQSASGTDANGGEAVEQCDNGKDDTKGCNGSGGNSACQPSECGDGHVNRADGEECDPLADPSLWDLLPEEMNEDGSLKIVPAKNGCNPDGILACKRALCGDGYVNVALLDNDPDAPFERCDPNAPIEMWFRYPGADPDTFPTECNSDSAGALKCQFAQCGDGKLSEGEECDPGTANSTDADGNSARCNGPKAPLDKMCRVTECGDGYKNTAAGEECDDGTATNTCTADCVRVSGCGDEIVNWEAGERCEKQANGSWYWCNAPEDLPREEDVNLHCKQYGKCGDGVCNLRIELFEEDERKCSWQIVCGDCDSGTVPLREERMLSVDCD